MKSLFAAIALLLVTTPVFAAPYKYTPAPTYRPAPVYRAPTPTYRAPTPTYRAPTPTYRAPTPTYSRREEYRRQDSYRDAQNRVTNDSIKKQNDSSARYKADLDRRSKR